VGKRRLITSVPFFRYITSSRANVGRILFLAGSLHVVNPADLSEVPGPITEVAEQIQAYSEAAEAGLEGEAEAVLAQHQMYPP
jgi:hypothetical protein